MRRAISLLLLVVAVGCKKPVPTAPAAPAAATTPAKKVIEAGNPEYDAMLAAFKADPKTKKFERDIVTFVMNVESVKEVDKQTYLVRGTGAGTNLICTFLLPPNLAVNEQVRTVVPGDKVTYWAEPATYKPGDPPTITSLGGSIMRVEHAKN